MRLIIERSVTSDHPERLAAFVEDNLQAVLHDPSVKVRLAGAELSVSIEEHACVDAMVAWATFTAGLDDLSDEDRDHLLYHLGRIVESARALGGPEWSQTIRFTESYLRELSGGDR